MHSGLRAAIFAVFFLDLLFSIKKCLNWNISVYIFLFFQIMIKILKFFRQYIWYIKKYQKKMPQGAHSFYCIFAIFIHDNINQKIIWGVCPAAFLDISLDRFCFSIYQGIYQRVINKYFPKKRCVFLAKILN